MSNSERAPLRSEGETEDLTHYAENSMNVVQTTIDRIGFGKYQVVLGLAIAIAVISDGAEVALVSLITFILEDVWDLSSTELGLLGGAIFIGMSIGLLIIATWGDDWGRLPALKLTYIGALALRLACAVMPEFWSFVVFRGLTGIVQAMSMPPVVAIAVESCPSKYRGSFTMFVIFNYGVGQIYVIGLAALLTPDLDGGMWRLLLVLAALPILIGILVLFTKVVESPMSSARRGLNQTTVESLEYIAKTNGQDQMTEGEKTEVWALSPLHKEKGFYKFKVLFDSSHKFMTLLLIGQWVLTTFVYFGFFYLLPQLLDDIDSELSTFLLLSLVIVCEMVVIAATTYLIELPSLGRKGTMKICYGVLVFFCGVCLFVSENYLLVPSIMIISAFNHGSFCVLWPYTSEVFETEVREMGVAFLNATGRAVAFFAPLVFGYLLESAVWAPFLLILSIGVCLLGIAFLLPIETRGISLDTGQQSNITK